MKTHAELCKQAILWLYHRRCSVYANEVPTENGIADALGVITKGSPPNAKTVYYIEAKASRADLICKKQKRVYEDSFKFHPYDAWLPAIDFYYLIVASGVVVEDSLYPQWGVIDENGNVIRKAKRYKHNIDRAKYIQQIAHVLVYKYFGKLYLPPQLRPNIETLNPNN